MQRTSRLLQLVERIYESVVDSDGWHDFVAELSEALGGTAVQLSLRLPDTEPTPDAYFRHGLDAAYHGAFVKHALLGLPWSTMDDDLFRARFAFGETQEHSIEESPFYREFMKPQGLAAESPLWDDFVTVLRVLNGDSFGEFDMGSAGQLKYGIVKKRNGICIAAFYHVAQ